MRGTSLRIADLRFRPANISLADSPHRQTRHAAIPQSTLTPIAAVTEPKSMARRHLQLTLDKSVPHQIKSLATLGQPARVLAALRAAPSDDGPMPEVFVILDTHTNGMSAARGFQAKW